MKAADRAGVPDIIATGVPGFDQVLGGGVRRGGLYLIEGRAGAGKTILASQIAFHRAAHGDRVIYLTVLAESHGKLIGHLRLWPSSTTGWFPSGLKC